MGLAWERLPVPLPLVGGGTYPGFQGTLIAVSNLGVGVFDVAGPDFGGGAVVSLARHGAAAVAVEVYCPWLELEATEVVVVVMGCHRERLEDAAVGLKKRWAAGFDGL